MRPDNDHSYDFDNVDGFAYDRSQSLHRLVKEARREERHRNRHRGSSTARHHRDNWDWENDADWDSYDNDSRYEFYEDLNSPY